MGSTQDEELLRGLPADLRASLMKLRSYESTILSKLNGDPNLADLFLKDPGGALVKMGIPINNYLRKCANTQGRVVIPPVKKICLPNGQTITPKIKVRYVPHREST